MKSQNLKKDVSKEYWEAKIKEYGGEFKPVEYCLNASDQQIIITGMKMALSRLKKIIKSKKREKHNNTKRTPVSGNRKTR